MYIMNNDVYDACNEYGLINNIFIMNNDTDNIYDANNIINNDVYAMNKIKLYTTLKYTNNIATNNM